jgi:pimeloyl-ACP methyl ester carboxylesterase
MSTERGAFPALPPALTGERREIASPAGRLSYYVAGPGSGTGAGAGAATGAGLDAGTGGVRPAPVLLIHSVNAAGSAYEVRPLYERLRPARTVYALDLPGFGFSDRSERAYTPRLMTDAVLGMVDEIRALHGGVPVDALALSLASEFLARAAVERPDAFRTLALVSPTGFSGRGPREGAPGSDRGMPGFHRVVAARAWRRALFGALTRRGTIRYFLQRTYGGKQVDEGLLDYDWLTTHQPGAEHAPLYFLSGFLFSADVGRLYRRLTQPLWMSHGVRGDFVDYRHEAEFAGNPRWRLDVFPTGALPQFEQPDEFARCYRAFLDAGR